MAQSNVPSEAALERVRAAYEKSAEQAAREREALAALHRTLMAMSEETVRLHRSSLARIEAIGRDVERVVQRLRRMNVSRS
jgi:hypothetical protein